MASVTKFDSTAIVNQLRHIERQIVHSCNPDIDRDRTEYNYSMIEPRGISSYEYFKKRKSELYVYGRKDVKLMAGWIVTAPKDLPEEKQRILTDRIRGQTEIVTKRFAPRALLTALDGGDLVKTIEEAL